MLILVELKDKINYVYETAATVLSKRKSVKNWHIVRIGGLLYLVALLDTTVEYPSAHVLLAAHGFISYFFLEIFFMSLGINSIGILLEQEWHLALCNYLFAYLQASWMNE